MRSFQYLVATATAMALFLTGCPGKKHEASTKPAEPAAVVTGVTIETVTASRMAETQEIVGTVRARTSAVVSTRIPGTVSELRVREGDRVRKGQLLARLDAQENQAAASAAVAGFDETKRGLDEALTRKKLADRTFERYQNLFNEQAVSRQEFDVKLAERDVAAQTVYRAEARLKQARETSRGAATMADYTRIIAPIAGIVTSKQADLGATVFPGQPLLTIEDDTNYQLELAIPESLAATIKPGTPLQITLDAVGDSFAAKIDEIVPAADAASRTFSAKINLTRKGLKSGMFGRGSLALGTSKPGMMVSKKSGCRTRRPDVGLDR